MLSQNILIKKKSNNRILDTTKKGKNWKERNSISRKDVLNNLQNSITGKEIPRKWRAPEASENNKRVIDKVHHTYNPAIKGWVKDITLDNGAAANITTTQLEILEALVTKNERLKTDLGNLDAATEKSANYTWSQMLLNTTTPTPTKEQQHREIQTQMQQLRE